MPAPPKRRTPKAGHKTIYLVRHGQAEHNVSGNLALRDPPLTAFGKRQAKVLDMAPVLQGRKVELVVASPLRRTLETAVIGFANQEPKPLFIAHPDVQETGAHPSDTGVEASNLEADFGEVVDLSLCVPKWYEKPAPFDPETGVVRADGCEALKKRLARLADWLLERPEQSIAVVSHHGVFGHLPGVEMELSNCEVVEASLDAQGWAVQRAGGEVMLVVDNQGRQITNYFGDLLSSTVSAIRLVHGKRAAIFSERNNQVGMDAKKSALQAAATVEVAGTASNADEVESGAARGDSAVMKESFFWPSDPDARKRKVIMGVGVCVFVAIFGTVLHLMRQRSSPSVVR
mmetsp:Transcript_8073/g.23727  ORF Transcript_8073/g.23727 Transcript_8073/m.23727 type:complete len:345 (+) Transcript_8073:87-1121(+)